MYTKDINSDKCMRNEENISHFHNFVTIESNLAEQWVIINGLRAWETLCEVKNTKWGTFEHT
jgi:hypothetical protein